MPEKQNDFSWLDIWNLLSDEEQEQAVQAFASELLHGPEAVRTQVAPRFLRKLARTVHFRPQSLASMGDAGLAKVLRRAMPGIMDEIVWKILFAAHYFANKRTMMCRFLDLCGIEHDERGGVDGEVTAPKNIREVTARLVDEFGPDEVRRYYQVLLLHGPETWRFVAEAMPEPAEDEPGAKATEVEEQQAEKEENAAIDQELIEDFTQLDRVLIEQVIATAAGEERALAPEEVFDLVQTVHALDTGRKRTYFHLGFLNALLGDGGTGLHGPEMNDARREWYLAGALAGLARQRDLARIDRLLETCRGDFERAAKARGGAGVSMAKTVFPLLLESGRMQPALALLRGRFASLADGMGPFTLEQASELLRRNRVAEAKALLDALHERLEALGSDCAELWNSDFCLAVRRKLGQAYQASGELGRAKKLFQDLLRHRASASPKLLADMGLVEAGFSGLQEVRIEGGPERRQTLVAAIEKGKRWFEDAVSQFPDDAHHAHYALAVYHYLQFMDGGVGAKDNPDICKSAIRHAEAALSGIIGSDESNAFDSLGITGQCRFILATLRMSLLDPSQAISAMRAWEAIPAHAGRFPKEHLARLLEWAELADTETAILIAESIWDVRGNEALELLRQQEWVIRSEKLRKAFLDAAEDTHRPRQERFDLWAFLVPALIRSNLPKLACDGLDAMEELAEEDSDLAERFACWLGDKSHYDPAWDEAEMLRARYRCLSRKGDNTEAVATLRNLFHAIKLSDPVEAVEVRRLVSEYEGGEQSVADLVVPDDGGSLSTEDVASIEERLKSGERVKVLFIGGNEIQARYDERVRNAIRRDWPGVEIVFEHTGWSSNWGHEVGRLKRMARESDAVVLMSMMRTLLGRTMRAALNDPPRPWVPCTGTGRRAIENSIRTAVRIGLAERDVEIL